MFNVQSWEGQGRWEASLWLVILRGVGGAISCQGCFMPHKHIRAVLDKTGGPSSPASYTRGLKMGLWPSRGNRPRPAPPPAR